MLEILTFAKAEGGGQEVASAPTSPSPPRLLGRDYPGTTKLWQLLQPPQLRSKPVVMVSSQSPTGVQLFVNCVFVF